MSRKRKAAALVTACIIGVFLSIMGIAFTIRSIQEKNLASRYINSVRAFWLAEAGVAEGLENLSAPSVSGCFGCPQVSSCCYQATIQSVGIDYQIDSSGSVILPSGAIITNEVSVVARIQPPDLEHAIETTGELLLKGNAYTINGTINENAIVDFSSLFGESKEDIELRASNYYDDELGSPVNGITWVDVSLGSELGVAGDLQGSGILVISGDVHFSGSFVFDGVVYVAGKLRMSGTPVIRGAIFAESETDIDTTIAGHVTIEYDPIAINNALGYAPEATSSGSSEVISWSQTN